MDLRATRLPLTAALILALSLAACAKKQEEAAIPAISPTELAAIDTPPPAYPAEAECDSEGGTTVLRVILPQLASRLLVSLRLMLGSAWLFLISAEAISATAGLGYRIFLVRRYMAMDVILPYVLWITALAWFMDWLLRQANLRLFPWSEGGK